MLFRSASKTPTPAPTARSSQAARDERRNHAEDPGHRRRKSPERHSRAIEDLPTPRGAGENGMRPRGRDRAPSDMVRSRSASRSVQVSLPPTPVEALARAQLLLDFPPTTGKQDEWRATIRSLVAVANKDEPSPVEPRVDAPIESHTPVAGKPAAPRPRCTRLLLARYRGRQPVATLRATKSP